MCGRRGITMEEALIRICHRSLLSATSTRLEALNPVLSVIVSGQDFLCLIFTFNYSPGDYFEECHDVLHVQNRQAFSVSQLTKGVLEERLTN